MTAISLSPGTIPRASFCLSRLASVFWMSVSAVLLIVSSEENSKIIIKLLDVSGHAIYDINQNSVDGLYQKTLNTSSLDKGVYLIQIIENGKQTIKKVVKK